MKKKILGVLCMEDLINAFTKVFGIEPTEIDSEQEIVQTEVTKNDIKRLKDIKVQKIIRRRKKFTKVILRVTRTTLPDEDWHKLGTFWLKRENGFNFVIEFKS